MQSLHDPNVQAALAAAAFLLALALGIAAAAFGRSLSIHVGKISAELRPNGGSSTKDAIDRIERRQKLKDRKDNAFHKEVRSRLNKLESKGDAT